jgi:streptogramin lyase
MRSLIIAAASVAFLASGAAAFAADQTEGTVASVNASEGTLVLKSGESFKFQNGAQLLGVVPGQDIGVTYTGQGNGVGAFNPHPANTNNIDIN